MVELRHPAATRRQGVENRPHGFKADAELLGGAGQRLAQLGRGFVHANLLLYKGWAVSDARPSCI